MLGLISQIIKVRFIAFYESTCILNMLDFKLHLNFRVYIFLSIGHGMASYDARHAMYMSGTLILHIKNEVLVMIRHDTLHILKYLGVIDGEKD